jgi:cyclopropane-fatty-acyl-phospholipid synthase
MSSLLFALSGQAGTVAPSLGSVFKHYNGAPFAIRFSDDSRWYSHHGKATFELCLRTEDAWNALSRTPDEVSLGTRYVNGEIDVEGDLYAALRAMPQIEEAIAHSIPASVVAIRNLAAELGDHLGRLLHLGALHSHKRDAAAISQHYDKPSEFYELFLGPSMVYSCAYFRSWEETLDEAQRNKMDLICRKLGLEPQESFLDIGCGWGSLVLHAAERYSAAARGVSLSKEQVAYGQRRIAAHGQAERCEVSWSDFRDLEDGGVQFDKIASVGMVEHVGEKYIAAYFREAHKLLRCGGLFLNHGITRSASSPHTRRSFIDRFVFPDGELLTLSQMIAAAESAGFEVRDVEDLREHYEETLHRWVQGLTEHEHEAATLCDAKTFRIWRLYMAGSAEAFRCGDIAIHQLLLSKNDCGQSSATRVRAAWYKDWQAD